MGIDVTKTIRRPTPEDWRFCLQAREVDVLPLVKDLSKDEHSPDLPGWMTYPDSFEEFPEVEYFCGAINARHPAGAGLWRQGNLLHFGFEESPAELNQTGQALLLNAIAYISRFTEDRPIARSPSVFVGPYPRPRHKVPTLLTNETSNLADLMHFLAPTALAEVKNLERPACRAWWQQNGRYLYPNREGLLAIDMEAKALGVGYDGPAFFERAIADLGEPGDVASRARRLLARLST